MLTFSEQVATTAIWGLTLIGFFFGGRAAWRRRKQRKMGKRNKSLV